MTDPHQVASKISSSSHSLLFPQPERQTASIMSHSHSHSHTHDNVLDHSHAHDDPFGGHGHSHDILDGPGSYLNREQPLIDARDWKDRAFTIGIGG